LEQALVEVENVEDEEDKLKPKKIPQNTQPAPHDEEKG